MSSLRSRDEKYHLLPDDGESETHECEESQRMPDAPFHILSLQRIGLVVVICVCTASLLGNLIMYMNIRKTIGNGTGFANLVYNIPTPIYSSTEYGPAIGTQADRDRLWAALDISKGMIAIPDEVAKKHGLPLSERFPWDQSKGIYLLGAHHQVHCLKQIYEFISVSQQGGVPKHSYEHILHCLDHNLQDAWCHADDTPWMILPPQPYRQQYDLYQTRQCKSFEKLQSWAQDFNACYQNEHILDADGNPTEDPLEHYKYCPEGSPYIPIMEKFFEQRAQGINATEAYESLHKVS